MAASKNPVVRLGHIRDEIAALTRTFDGIGFETFVSSYMLRRTAEHVILIISEAVKALSATVTDHYPGVDWRAVRDIGNVLRHDYFEVDARVLWRVLQDRLPEMKPVIDRMMQDYSV